MTDSALSRYSPCNAWPNNHPIWPLREPPKFDHIAGAECIARCEKIRSLVRQRGRGNQQAKIKEDPHRNPSKKQSRGA